MTGLKGGVHGAHLLLVMHWNIAARERAGDKELRGGHGALQAVGVGINAFPLAGIHPWSPSPAAPAIRAYSGPYTPPARRLWW